MVKIITTDDKTFEISSELFQLIEAYAHLDDDDDEIIIDLNIQLNNQLDNVSIDSEIMGKIIEFMNFYIKKPLNDIVKPLISHDMKDVVNDQFYANFIDVRLNLVKQLLMAADYLAIKPLLMLCAAKIGSKIRGLSAEQISNLTSVDQFTIDDTNEADAAIAAAVAAEAIAANVNNLSIEVASISA